MSDRRRRIYGFIIGLAFGLPYVIASEFINLWMLPGIPLFELPLGHVTTVVLTSIFMGVLGLIVVWSEESIWGILSGAFFIVLMGSIQAYINSGLTQGVNAFFLFLFTFLPRIVIYLPLAFFFRWAVNNFDQSSPDLVRGPAHAVTVTIALLFFVGSGGWFSMLIPEARLALQDANALVLEGMTALENGEDLPEPFILLDGFPIYAKGHYTLEWSSDVDSLSVGKSSTPVGVTESLIIVRFENTYQFGCVYTSPSHIPKCVDIYPH